MQDATQLVDLFIDHKRLTEIQERVNEASQGGFPHMGCYRYVNLSSLIFCLFVNRDAHVHMSVAAGSVSNRGGGRSLEENSNSEIEDSFHCRPQLQAQLQDIGCKHGASLINDPCFHCFEAFFPRRS